MAKPGAKTISQSGSRAPRIAVEYEVWKFDAKGKVVIPFVVGALSDLTGKPPTAPVEPGPDASKEDKKKYQDEKKRYEAYLNTKNKFLDITSSNIDVRMKATRPRISCLVPNRLSDEGGMLKVDLEFENMGDWDPASVARRLEPTRRLLEEIERLKYLAANLGGNEDAQKLVADVVEKLRAMATKSS